MDSKEQLLALLELPSNYTKESLEGIYLRLDDQVNDDLWLSQALLLTTMLKAHLAYRGKLVRPDFMAGMTKRWNNQLQKNKLREDVYD